MGFSHRARTAVNDFEVIAALNSLRFTFLDWILGIAGTIRSKQAMFRVTKKAERGV